MTNPDNSEETHDSLVPRPDEDWDDDMGDEGFVVFLASEDFEAMEVAYKSLDPVLSSYWTGSGFGFGVRDHDYECPTLEEAREVVAAYSNVMENAGSDFKFAISEGWEGETLESGGYDE